MQPQVIQLRPVKGKYIAASVFQPRILKFLFSGYKETFFFALFRRQKLMVTLIHKWLSLSPRLGHA